MLPAVAPALCLAENTHTACVRVNDDYGHTFLPRIVDSVTCPAPRSIPYGNNLSSLIHHVAVTLKIAVL